MPTLEWIGKSKVINHHQDVPFRVLERKYSFDENGQHNEDNGSENMIIRGDNLEALKALLPRYEGRVKCIYIDPPYNTGNEGWVYNDNVNDPKIKKWLGEVVGKEGEDLTRHDKWLCMMYPRLKLLQKLLADDGAIFISIDDNELANLKLICDEIFGKSNFIETIIWDKKAGAKGVPPRSMLVNVHEYIVVYSKKSLFSFVGELRRAETDGFSNPDNDPRGPWRMSNIKSTTKSNDEAFTITDPKTGKQYTNTWAFSVESLKKMISEGRILWKESLPKQKEFLYEMKNPNKAIKTTWGVFDPQSTTVFLKDILPNQRFDNAKPIKLMDYFMQVATGPDDIILDSFAGSGTTAHAVLNMNKADGGHRKFILVEMMDYADSITAERVKRVIRGYGEGKNAVEGTGGSFSFYDLGEPLLVGDCLNEAVAPEKIREYIWFMETKQPYAPPSGGNPYYLGKHNSTGYYFYYEPQRVTVLDYAFLSTITEKADGTVIYADRCSISEDKLAKIGVTFKKIPRDISRL